MRIGRLSCCVPYVVLTALAGPHVLAQVPSSAPGWPAEAGLGEDFFPILPWDRVHGRSKANGLASIAECGFTLAGFVHPEDLTLCDQLGLKAILAPLPGIQEFSRDGWRKLSDGDIDRMVREMVEAARGHPSVAGYFLMDEPGVPAFPALAKAVSAVRRRDPGKLAYINLFPGYATIGAPDRSQLGAASFTEYLETYVRVVRPQFISYDNYMVQYSDDLQNAQATASYFRDLLEVRRVALAHGLPFWNIVSSNQIRPVTPPPSPANLLLQAHTTLAAGGRGVSWYTYYSRGYGYAPVDPRDQRTSTWNYLRMANAEIRALGPIMNRLRSTGVFFTSPRPADTCPGPPGRLVAGVQATTSVRQKSSGELPMMIGEFSDSAGNDYVMAVNLSLGRSVNVRLRLHAERKMNIIRTAGGAPVTLDPEQGQWLVAGQGALIRLDQ
jgi:hypothetical protein